MKRHRRRVAWYTHTLNIGAARLCANVADIAQAKDLDAEHWQDPRAAVELVDAVLAVLALDRGCACWTSPRGARRAATPNAPAPQLGPGGGERAGSGAIWYHPLCAHRAVASACTNAGTQRLLLRPSLPKHRGAVVWPFGASAVRMERRGRQEGRHRPRKLVEIATEMGMLATPVAGVTHAPSQTFGQLPFGWRASGAPCPMRTPRLDGGPAHTTSWC